MSFQKGDVVILKSGGPSMTVDNIQKVFSGQVVVCTWFDKEHKYCSQTFSPETLEIEKKPGLGVKK